MSKSGRHLHLSQDSSQRSGQLSASVDAPRAPQKEHRIQHHGITLQDPWHWLRDPAYPEVDSQEILDYLHQENSYFDSVMSPHQSVIDTLFAELSNYQPEQDEGVPFQQDGWLYQWRLAKGAQYRTWWRCALTDENWQCILDEPAMAKGVPNFSLAGWSCSPNGRYLAWASDAEGGERFTLWIRNLQTGALLDAPITDTLAVPLWGNDNQTLFYVVLNDQWRPYQVKMHRLGSSPDQDLVLYEEASNSFWVGIALTQSRDWLVIIAKDHETSELRLLPAGHPTAPLRLVTPRRTGHIYALDHANGRFWIRTNDQHKNFRLVSTPEETPAEEHWQEELAATDDRYLADVQTFQHFYAVSARVDGLDRIFIRSYEGGEQDISFPEPAYRAALGVNIEFATNKVRLNYSSLVTPETVFDYIVADQRLDTLKVQVIPSGYDSSLYQCERLQIKARDSVEIPVSVVYRRDLRKDGTNNLYLYGYGAYGHVVEPHFATSRLSLLERGYVCAIAHIRGGADLGHQWYEDGKLFKRGNTFNDFVDVAHALIEAGYTARGRIAILGGSAGGELMGAAINQAPQLWGAVVAHVPFVDVLNTMLDESLPLTPMEWSEWGNPVTDKTAFEFIRSYSPYDQTQAMRYPPMLVTGGLNDPRVTYWEPAKWVAKLRHLKVDANILLLKTEMTAGHQGNSGRYARLREQAETWAFILLAMDTWEDLPESVETDF